MDAFKDRIRQVTTAVAATQNESFIQPIGDAFANTPGPRQLVTDKSLKELEEAQNKRNKKTDEWKQKLKAANEELKKSQQTVQALQQAQENLVKSATFGGAIASLSKLTSQAATAQRGTGEREGLNRLLTAGFNKFQQFDPNNLGGQQQQKIEITITSDEAGIITPVVKSQQLNEQVVTIITKTMNNQARVNDR